MLKNRKEKILEEIQARDTSPLSSIILADKEISFKDLVAKNFLLIEANGREVGNFLKDEQVANLLQNYDDFRRNDLSEDRLPYRWDLTSYSDLSDLETIASSTTIRHSLFGQPVYIQSAPPSLALAAIAYALIADFDLSYEDAISYLKLKFPEDQVEEVKKEHEDILTHIKME